MKFCSQCGVQMQDIDKFCMKCGNEYAKNDSVKDTLPPGSASPLQTSAQDEADISLPLVVAQVAPRLDSPPRPKRGSGLRTKLILGAILAIVLTIGCFWGWNTYGTEAQVEKKLDLAVKYLSENNYEQAILAFNDVIRIDPKEVKGYQGLARTYTLQGKYDEARVTYEKGITAVTIPQNKQILQLGLAGMYIDQNKFTDAEQAYSQIINTSPNCLEAYFGLAMVYNQQRDNSKAEAILKQAVEKNPNEYRGYNALALFLFQNNKPDEALDNIVQSLTRELNQQEAYLVLDAMYQNKWSEMRSKTAGMSSPTIATMLEFYSYYAAGDYSHAISTYQNQLSTQNGNHKAMIMAAICMVKNGDKALSESLIKQIKIFKLNPWLLGDLGRYYLAAGDQVKAKEYALKALQANPPNLDAIALLQAINANDSDARFYTARALLYNWKPVSKSNQPLLNWNEPRNNSSINASQNTEESNATSISNKIDETQKNVLKQADEAYNQKILQYKNTARYYDKYSSQYRNKTLNYTKHDIDKDGIPELIVKTGTCEADYLDYVYTYKNGKLIEAGSFSGFHQRLYDLADQNGILSLSGQMLYEIVYRIALNNDHIISSKIIEKEVDNKAGYDQFPNEIEMITIFP